MQVRQLPSALGTAALALLMAALPSCGPEKKYDWKNREIPWTYGPTNDTATQVHLTGTGKKGPGAISKGWQCHLVDGKNLVVKPFELAASHALFGKVMLSVGLFDKDGKQLGAFTSGTVTAENATFTFELTEAVAKPLLDVVIWFREV
jgi:hypothetical protein